MHHPDGGEYRRAGVRVSDRPGPAPRGWSHEHRAASAPPLRSRGPAHPLLGSSEDGRRDRHPDRDGAQRVREKLRVVIADDERPARSVLAAMLRTFDNVEIVGEARVGGEALTPVGGPETGL